MCWAITTGQGNPAGSCGRISSSVPGPPVDTPTSTMPSLSRDSGGSAFSARTARTRCARDSRRPARATAEPARSPPRAPSRPAHADPNNVPRDGAVRLVDEVDRAELERLERCLGARLGQRGNHHHGLRPLHHDAREAGQAVHLRHVDVERDDVRVEFVQRLATPPIPLRTASTREVPLLPRTIARGGVASTRNRRLSKLDHGVTEPLA